MTANRNFVALFVGERHRMIVDFLVGSRIRTRISGDRVVLAVVIARPFAMQRFTVAIGAIYGDFHAVSSDLVDTRGALRRPRGRWSQNAWRPLGPCFSSAVLHFFWLVQAVQRKMQNANSPK